MPGSRGALYIKTIGGDSINIADYLNDPQNKVLERVIIDCDTTNGLPTAIQLPTIASLGGAMNFEVIVSDRSGNAAVGNITVNRGGTTDIINGGSTNVVMNTSHAKAIFFVANTNTSGTGAGWAGFNTASSTPYTPPTQVNEVGVVAPGNVFTLANTPLTTQHLIVTLGRQVLTIGTDFTIAGSTITFIFGAAGDPINIWYSY